MGEPALRLGTAGSAARGSGRAHEPDGALGSAASRVYFLPSGEFGAGRRDFGGAGIHADRSRGDGYVSAYDARRIDRGIREAPMNLGPLMVDIAGTELAPEDIEVLSHPLVG